MMPLCFVLMPFGRKPDGSGRTIDFDAVYREIVAPAVEAAAMEPIRADQEEIGGTIHKPMFERLMLCDYAVADVTGANPNVYYELGIRHALRPHSTVIVFADNTALPFDIAAQRGVPYRLDESGGLVDAPGDCDVIAKRLRAAHENAHDDSPLFQLIDGMPRLEVGHEKTDIFRDRVAVAQSYRRALASARRQGVEAVKSVADDPRLADLRNVEAGIVIDLLLSFRAVGTADGCQEMIDLYDRMPKALQHARMVREQLGFALNRVGRSDEAAEVLNGVIDEFGQNSETNGLLGRVYKDLWETANAEGRAMEARGYLRRAIATYRAGFEADWRDPYPGVNALTLMEIQETPDPAQEAMLPVVRYAAAQRAGAGRPGGGDYWDQATLLEVAVLDRDPDTAETAATAALAVVREPWEPATTRRNLRLIREARAARDEDVTWIDEIEEALSEAENRLKGS
ncbi:TRAFs-binding domain-containing protein [Bauldia sp.]|uniref:TRAFs-binding domain-containing protein n=1 Tax=Bauldia sp. TaxID=2575872 RepID=UPI003BA95EF1